MNFGPVLSSREPSGLRRDAEPVGQFLRGEVLYSGHAAVVHHRGDLVVPVAGQYESTTETNLGYIHHTIKPVRLPGIGMTSYRYRKVRPAATSALCAAASPAGDARPAPRRCRHRERLPASRGRQRRLGDAMRERIPGDADGQPLSAWVAGVGWAMPAALMTA